MAEYRAYAVGRDGHFIGYEPLVCDDDSEAIEKARRLVDGHDVELWSGERFITRVSPARE
jgi:alkanesulfonate monooxygenase SsuD/methylene tetrahydromethanopterin reductase-like flavin-dependent oxidoreductase (luciferase family)